MTHCTFIYFTSHVKYFVVFILTFFKAPSFLGPDQWFSSSVALNSSFTFTVYCLALRNACLSVKKGGGSGRADRQDVLAHVQAYTLNSIVVQQKRGKQRKTHVELDCGNVALMNGDTVELGRGGSGLCFCEAKNNKRSSNIRTRKNPQSEQ